MVHGVHTMAAPRRYTPHAASTQYGVVIKHHAAVVAAPGLAIATLPFVVAMPGLADVPSTLQIPSLRAQPSSPHHVRRVHVASAHRREGTRDFEQVGDAIRETRQKETRVRIERKRGRIGS